MQEVVSARALLSAESLPLATSEGAAEPGTTSLLQFVRADVDEWIQSESTPSALAGGVLLPDGVPECTEEGTAAAS
ncbi:hypothetical protein TRAPUB_1048 [Trametes pubescens]|uniref:Uncharacterized protein n=1 Tax=Trametes pubescens TaxID=154538 RepID=A0A1M2VKP7_TRAPU|nr:hypothetical protein TRAPUB_1048 [Trametes pubescens]